MTLSWPRLIGIAAGTFGAAIAIATGVGFIMADSFRGQTAPQLIIPICGCAFLVLAFPLYVGRDWARRALLVTTYCIIAAIAIVIFPLAFQRTRSSSGLPIIMVVCVLISFLTPPTFFLAVLHHTDIRRAFQAKDVSNQAMQPTASPRTSPLFDD